LGLAFRHAIRTAQVRAPIPEQICPQLRGGSTGTRLAYPSSVLGSIVSRQTESAFHGIPDSACPDPKPEAIQRGTTGMHGKKTTEVK
jgi:hypothetical protein